MWQPIETAPKDRFLLLCGPSGYTTIPLVFTTGRMCSDYHAGRWIDHANDDLSDWGFEPTHWAPLPEAPDSQETRKMSPEFEREDRYIVFKISDVVEHLTTTEAIHLARLYEIQRVGRKEAGKSELECVVVEADWPEYEPTWRAIEARTTGAQPAPSVPREAIEKMLTQLMDIAVSNGANSISMPDEYVEVAAWLCGIPAQPAPSVPEGWKLVPIEPTREMIQKACSDHGYPCGDRSVYARGYRAMLAAAPEAKQ